MVVVGEAAEELPLVVVSARGHILQVEIESTHERLALIAAEGLQWLGDRLDCNQRKREKH